MSYFQPPFERYIHAQLELFVIVLANSVLLVHYYIFVRKRQADGSLDKFHMYILDNREFQVPHH